MDFKGIINQIKSSEGAHVEAIRFALVGGVATVIQYLCYLLLLKTGVISAEVATVVSYCISLIFNFILSNVFTFKTKATTRKATGFLMSHMVNLGMQTGLVYVFSHIIAPSIALIPAMIICIPINFLLVRLSLKGRTQKSVS